MSKLFEPDVIVTTKETKFETTIFDGVHTWIADEPKDKEGTDLGPTPYQLLASSLGACTSITLRMYSERKQIVLRSIEVHVNIEKTGNDEYTFIRLVKLDGDLTSDQKERLLQVANACPIHKILSGKIHIETKPI